MSAPDWSNAPSDVLWCIIPRLPMADYIKFGAVCKSWRVALKEKRQPPLPLPWLVLHDGETQSPVKFLSFFDNKEYLLDLPHILKGLAWIGSSNGWLISLQPFAEQSEVLLFNPITRAHVLLPPVGTLPIHGVPHPRHTLQHHIYDIYTFAVSPSGSSFAVCPSGSSSKVLASGIKLGTGELAFATQRDKSWRAIETSGNLRFCSLLFYKPNLLCGLAHNGAVVFCDLSDLSHPVVNLVLQPPPPCFDISGPSIKYLIESSSGRLVQVWRCVEEEIQGGTKPWLTQLSEEFEGGLLTTSLRVFVMDEKLPNNVQWVEMENTNNDAYFLGSNSALAFSCQSFPEMRRNVAYLTTVYGLQDTNSDFALFAMEERAVEPIVCFRNSNSEPTRMFWFIPKFS